MRARAAWLDVATWQIRQKAYADEFKFCFTVPAMLYIDVSAP